MADNQVAVMQASTGQVQLVQVNSSSQVQQVIQGANGQQIVVHAVPQPANPIQVAPANGQIQVVPVQSLQVKIIVFSSYIYINSYRHIIIDMFSEDY